MSDPLDFLGTGWSFPPCFDAGGAVLALRSGHDDIAESLAILLATRPGERLMEPGYGCALDEFLFGEVSARLLGRLRDLVSDAVLHHVAALWGFPVRLETVDAAGQVKHTRECQPARN